jgi:toxin ParE1/3/4
LRIHWTERASLNLDDVENYIARANPDAAIQTVLKIIRAVEQLVDHPNLGRPGRVTGTRELVISGASFLVPYRVCGDSVEILCVFHGAMKWPEEL